MFARLGAELEILKQVQGAPEKARELVKNRPELADSTLFEFLVALLWKRNGWSSVSFVPESPSAKTPDLVAQSGGSRWAIECKRLAKKSDYSTRERMNRLKLWRPLCLVEFKPVAAQPFTQNVKQALGAPAVLKGEHNVVSVAHQLAPAP